MKGFLLPALLVVLAEIGARWHGPSDSVAPPSQAVLAFGEALADGSLMASTRDTLIAAFGGLVIGATIGLALGVALGLSRPFDRLMELPVEVLRPIPSVAVIPVALVALGFGYRLEIAIVAFACVWPMLIFTRAAVASVEPRLLEVARALRLTPWATVGQNLDPGRAAAHFRRLPAGGGRGVDRGGDGGDRRQPAGAWRGADDGGRGAAAGSDARLSGLGRRRGLRA